MLRVLLFVSWFLVVVGVVVVVMTPLVVGVPWRHHKERRRWNGGALGLVHQEEKSLSHWCGGCPSRGRVRSFLLDEVLTGTSFAQS